MMNHFQKPISHRRFLIGAAGITLALVGGCGAEDEQGGPVFNSVGALDFINPLAIPPLAPATVQGNQRRFGLVAQRGESEIFLGQKTETWGFNGSFLGSTLQALVDEFAESDWETWAEGEAG